MKALSIRAPWWWWILYGGKDIENRSKPTKHRGPILLQASQWWNRKDVSDDMHAAVAMFRASGKLVMPAVGMGFDQVQGLGGHIIGMADIMDCIPPRSTYDHENYGVDSWHIPGQWGWKLANIVPLKNPYAAKGALGLFSAPASAEVVEILLQRRDAGQISEDAVNDILGV